MTSPWLGGFSTSVEGINGILENPEIKIVFDATEVLVAVLHKLGYETGIDLYKIMDNAEKLLNP
jgi:acetaldehyde dehydrogenase (acetylating)